MPNRNPPSGGPARLTRMRAVRPRRRPAAAAGTTERSAPAARRRRPRARALHERHDRDRPDARDGEPAGRARRRSRARASAAIMSRRRSNRSAASPAGSRRARGEEPGKRDEAGPGRRAGQRERQQRVGDRRRLRPHRGEQLPGLEQDEVAIAPQGREGPRDGDASTGGRRDSGRPASNPPRWNRLASGSRSTCRRARSCA